MDYEQLAHVFLIKFRKFRKGVLSQFDESFRGELCALAYIVEKDGSVSPSEISNEMNVSSARIAATLNSLESKDFITRKIDASNRRRIIVDPTPQGQEWATKNYHQAIGTYANLLEHLGEQDSLEFIRIIGRLAEIASETENIEQKT